MNEVVGKPLNRVDGRLKVMGQAKYSADMPIRHVAHAVFVVSSISRGSISSFDLAEAKKVPGFIDFYSHASGFKLKGKGMDPKSGGKRGHEEWLPLQDAKIHYNGQQIGLVLAENLEAATRAASLVQVKYSQEHSNVNADQAGSTEMFPKEFFGGKLQDKIGDVEKELKAAPDILIRETYTTPFEHHHPIEFHATIAQWDGDHVTVYDTTQNVVGTQNILAHMLSLKPEQVKVISYFLGGGFGCKGFFWPHTAVAALAAKKVARPVKLSLTREQMFTSNGHRSSTSQEVTLAATKDGKLKAIRHHSSMTTSQVAMFPEPCGLVTKVLYDCENIDIAHRLVRIDSGTPTPMRAPGETPGTFAIESAMDELAYKIGMDPLKLRLVNYAENSPEDKKEFSGKHLRECYEKASKAFGWDRRKMQPRSMRDGRFLVGWGMATASYPANRASASASAEFKSDGKLVVKSATQDIGTGTYTVMSQIAAEAFDLPMEKVQFELGNSTFPKGVLSGGSQTAASTGPAVRKVCLKLRENLLKAALADASSPLHGVEEKDILTKDGRFYSSSSPAKSISYVDVLGRLGVPSMTEKVDVVANTRQVNGIKKILMDLQNSGGPNTEKYSFHSFGAHFVEVRVDPESGEIRMGRMVGAFDIGKVLNHKTARSQCIGGMAWGIGQALLEETVFDQPSGRIATRNLADYRLPVHADIPPMEVIFIDTPDLNISDVGARGVGELPLTGSAAAIANAVFHATGKRIRDLPIVPEKILDI